MDEKLRSAVDGRCAVEVVEDEGLTFGVMHVAIDPDVARTLFDESVDVGDWGWKHRRWTIPEELLEVYILAARYFYGWDAGSEKVTEAGDGKVTLEAYYTC